MKKALIALTFLFLLATVRPALAEDYRGRNVFNHVSDWSVTFWRGPEERERIVNERIERRAQWREMRHRDYDRDMKKDYKDHDRDAKQDYNEREDKLKHDYEQKKYNNDHNH